MKLFRWYVVNWWIEFKSGYNCSWVTNN